MNNDNPKSVGCSNTPTTKSAMIFTSIDYFKFRFDRTVEEDYEKFEGLFKVLGVDFFMIPYDRGRNNYEQGKIIAPGIFYYFGGDLTRTAEGFRTSLLELKGEGCREYESLYAKTHNDSNPENAWLALFHECIQVGGVCTRIDLPVDDCRGVITVKDIQRKINIREYTTRMRTIEYTDSNVDEKDEILSKSYDTFGISDVVSQIGSHHKGYSCTLGNRTHVQLCIYDKFVEQANKGKDVPYKNWIRYETRYYHENAEMAFIFLVSSMRNHQSRQFILGCLKDNFQFKEDGQSRETNRSRLKPWSKWIDFLIEAKDVAQIKSPSEVASFEENVNWFIRSGNASFTRLVAVCNQAGINTSEVITALLLKGSRKLTKKDFMLVNSFLSNNNLKPFESLGELQQTVKVKNCFTDSFSELVTELILKSKSPKQIKDESNEKGETQK